MIDAMFEPLSDSEVAERPAAPQGEADWRPIVPAPQGKLPPDHPQHQRYGKPSRVRTPPDGPMPQQPTVNLGRGHAGNPASSSRRRNSPRFWRSR